MNSTKAIKKAKNKLKKVDVTDYVRNSGVPQKDINFIALRAHFETEIFDKNLEEAKQELASVERYMKAMEVWEDKELDKDNPSEEFIEDQKRKTRLMHWLAKTTVFLLT